MLRNYLTIALRNLRREKAYAAINLIGLAVGVACVLLVFLFVQNELSYDRYHEHAGRIYRVIADMQFGDHKMREPQTEGPLAAALVENFPEVERSVRIWFRRGGEVSVGDQRYSLGNIISTDSSLFDVFTFPLLGGDPGTALQRPYTAVLSRSSAERMFGDEDPIGQVVYSDLVGEEMPYEITGIMENVPANSHFRFDMAVSFATIHETRLGTGWGAFQFFTYVLLREGHSAGQLEAKLPEFIRTVGEPESVDDLNLTYELQPLLQVHLGQESAPEKGDMRYVYLFSAVAVLILLIAGANYMILATARSINRRREVGVRKALGAQRLQLVGQFLSESLLLALVAVPVALAVMLPTIPAVNAWLDLELSLDISRNGPFLIGVGLTVLFIGLVAGAYPAFFLSADAAANVLRGRSRTGLAGVRFRKVAVVLQFGVAVALLAATAIVYAQLRYVVSKDLGFVRENVVVVDLSPEAQDKRDLLKLAALQHSEVVSAALTGGMPGIAVGSRAPLAEKGEDWREAPSAYFMSVDADFIKTYKVNLTVGRGIEEERGADSTSGVILNEAAVRSLGWEQPLGRGLYTLMGHREIVGVVQDFHVQSLHALIDPVVLQLNPQEFYRLSVRIQPEKIREALTGLEKDWARIVPGEPFNYKILDDEIDALYRSEQRFGQLFAVFGGLAVFVACLGLFGLATFTAEQRTKEIGIRKVLGASASAIVVLLSKDYIKLVAVAFVLAAPLAYFGMERWLEGFAYRVEPSVGALVVAGASALLIALATVMWQSIKAARANPADSLRYE